MPAGSTAWPTYVNGTLALHKCAHGWQLAYSGSGCESKLIDMPSSETATVRCGFVCLEQPAATCTYKDVEDQTGQSTRQSGQCCFTCRMTNPPSSEMTSNLPWSSSEMTGVAAQAARSSPHHWSLCCRLRGVERECSQAASPMFEQLLCKGRALRSKGESAWVLQSARLGASRRAIEEQQACA